MKRTWSSEQLDLLTEKYPTSTPAELSVLFPDKTYEAIRGKAKVLKLKKKNQRFIFNESQLSELQKTYATTQNIDLAKKFGCSINTIASKANNIGLKKSTAFIAKIARIRSLNPDHGGAKTRYKKGSTPLNKGKKITDFMSPEQIENSAFHRFKVGSVPANRRSLGSERVTVDGYVEIKTTSGLLGWELKHRVVWRKYNGEIPKGFVVKFKDGNRLNCEIDNLLLFSRKKLMDNNSIMRYPDDVKKAIRQIGKLKQIIKKHEKDRT